MGVDGALMPDFERYINSVTVTLRKQHENGEQTLREIVLDRRAVEADGGKTGLRCLRLERRSGPRRVAGYEYRTRWSFKGGGSIRPIGRARTRR